MGPDRFRAAVAVHGILREGDQVLLMRRAGSGHRDGELSLPAGHVDGGEDVETALVRELAEELTITVEPANCHLRVVAHRAAETAGDDEYVDFFFTIDRWLGTPAIGEPVKCGELVWASPHRLPHDTVDYVRRALIADLNSEPLILEGWDIAHVPHGRPVL